MPISDSVEIKVIVQDPCASSSEEMQRIVRAIVAPLENRADLVRFSDYPTSKPTGNLKPKGNNQGSILDVKINLETLRSFSGWLSQRLIGTPTEVTFKHVDERGETVFTFKGNKKAQETTMRDFERFIEAVRRS